MRSIGLVAFGITAGILVPAIALTLDAGPKQREMLFAPGADSLELDGTKIYATLDHKLVDPGGIANLSLRTEGKVAVGIVVLGSSGSEGDRVPSPPVAVVHQTVTIEAHTTKTVPLELGGAREDYTGFGSYSIYVMSPQAADRLALLQRRSGPPEPSRDPDNEIPSETPATRSLFNTIDQIGHDDLESKRDAALFGRGKVALFHAFSRPLNPAVKLDAPETATVGATIPITVAVTNPSKQDAVSIQLSLLFPRLDDSYLGVADTALSGDKAELELAAGETKQVELHVTAKQAGVIGVQVDVQCTGSDDCYRKLRTGAFEAIQITSERPTQTASTR